MKGNRRRDVAEVMRDEMLMHERIRGLLAEKPKTIPELAEALGAPSWEVTLWVMGMLRYGLVKEMPKSRADDYYPYAPAGD